MSVSKNECLCLRNIVFSSWETRYFSHWEMIFIPENHHLCLRGILSLSQKHCLCLRANCFCLRNSGFVSWKLGDCLIFNCFCLRETLSLPQKITVFIPGKCPFPLKKTKDRFYKKTETTTRRHKSKPATNQKPASKQNPAANQKPAAKQRPGTDPKRRDMTAKTQLMAKMKQKQRQKKKYLNMMRKNSNRNLKRVNNIDSHHAIRHTKRQCATHVHQGKINTREAKKNTPLGAKKETALDQLPNGGNGH